MNSLDNSYPNEKKFKLVVVLYYAVTLVGFVIGLYGLISLLSLATSEVERNAHILGALL
ncbi:MAG TPA: hypothetical protein VK747_08105 [Blastocatellia bacterium]|nr:hypothetical protein [Blastocatellia bacterium]